MVQGAVDPIYAFVYNAAPLRSDAGGHRVSAAYGVGYTGSFGFSYVGTKLADGGATFITLPFNLNTANTNPGNVPVKVTLTDTSNGGSVTEGGQFTVLAHAAPVLYVSGQIVPLSSRMVITFAAPVFAEAAPTGEVAVFNVNVEVTSTAAYWTITTHAVPKPRTRTPALGVFGICLWVGAAMRLSQSVSPARRFWPKARS